MMTTTTTTVATATPTATKSSVTENCCFKILQKKCFIVREMERVVFDGCKNALLRSF